MALLLQNTQKNELCIELSDNCFSFEDINLKNKILNAIKESTFKTLTIQAEKLKLWDTTLTAFLYKIIKLSQEKQIEVKYKKLYGIEHVADYELDKDGGIDVDFLEGDPAKILIFDENDICQGVTHETST